MFESNIVIQVKDIWKEATLHEMSNLKIIFSPVVATRIPCCRWGSLNRKFDVTKADPSACRRCTTLGCDNKLNGATPFVRNSALEREKKKEKEGELQQRNHIIR